MPTYKNNGTTQIYWRNVLWESGQTRALTYFVPYGDLGLTVTDDLPAVDSPVLVSEDVTLEAGAVQEKAIPYAARIIVSATAVTGTATLTVGDKEITLDDTADYVSTPLAWSKVESVSLVSAAGATVRLLVEEVL
jgi:hypothetical protein